MDFGNGVAQLPSIFDLNTSSVKNMKAGEKKDEAVAENFASIFVNEMLQSTRKDGLSEGSFLDSDQVDMSRKMYYQQISENIAHQKGFGITEMIKQAIMASERKT